MFLRGLRTGVFGAASEVNIENVGAEREVSASMDRPELLPAVLSWS